MIAAETVAIRTLERGKTGEVHRELHSRRRLVWRRGYVDGEMARRAGEAVIVERLNVDAVGSSSKICIDGNHPAISIDSERVGGVPAGRELIGQRVAAVGISRMR